MQAEECRYIKDLRVISNRPLKKMVLVDNAVYSFGHQVSNGIPILGFYEDKEDIEFLHLIQYMKFLSNESDLRKCNNRAFHLKAIMKTACTFVHYYLNADDEEDDEDTDFSNIIDPKYIKLTPIRK